MPRQHQRLSDRKFVHTASGFLHLCKKSKDGPCRLAWIGGAVRETTGYGPGDILRNGCLLPYVHPEDQDRFSAWSRQFQDGGFGSEEFRLVRPDGTVIWGRDTCCCAAGEAPDERLLYGTFRDITLERKVQEDLRESEMRFRALVESSRDLFWETDDRGAYTYVSPQIETILGYTPEEVLGRTPYDLLDPDQARVAQALFEPIFAHRTPFHGIQTSGRHKSGKALDLERSATPAFGAQGEFKGFRGVDRDTTRRMAAEAGVIKERARYRAVVEDQSELICRHLPDGRLTFVNEAFARYYQKSKQDILGQNFVPYIPAEEWPAVRGHLTGLSRSRPQAAFEHRVILPGGEIRWQAWTIRGIFTASGELQETQAVGRDITGLVQAEQNRELAELRYRALFEASPVGICQCTAEGRFLDANQAAASILGYASPQELVASVADIGVQVYATPEHRKKLLNDLEEKGKIEDFETQFRRKDGSPLWVSLSARGFKDATGRLRHQHAFLLDITERKALEALHGDVERIMRHDLKGPLNGLLGVPQLLLMADNITPDQASLIELITLSGNRMLAMIDSTAAMFQIETGAYQPKTSPVDLLEVLRRILQEMRSHLKSKRMETALSTPGGPAGEDERFLVPGDELLLHTMLHNLIKNGAEASPPAKPLHISLRSEDGNGLIAITNRGEVPENIRRRFFEKYVTSGKTGGTGLGTYSARLVAQAHAGAVTLDCSRPGQTTVTVRLPLARPA